MADLRRYLGRGLLFGLAAGALWVAGRYYAKAAPPNLISWETVRATALRLCRSAPPEAPWSRQECLRLYQELVRRSEELVSSYTGTFLLHPLESVHVFDRLEWLEANIANFQLLFAPLEELYMRLQEERRVGTHLMGNINQLALSSQLGLLLGYMAQRVLGQYDLSLFGREPITSGRIYFVEPNIANFQRRLNLDPLEFRQWIALHETTHALEFEAHPWLRYHMNSLLSSYFQTVSEELLKMGSGRGSFLALLRRVGENLFKTRYLIELMMTPQQQALFRQLQALMCLLEGYSNHVMDKVGRAVLRHYPTIKERFEERLKRKSPAERLFAKLTGLDIKLEQYLLGERFANLVVEERGLSFLNRAWRSPEALPSLAEVQEPRRWMARLEAA